MDAGSLSGSKGKALSADRFDGNDETIIERL